MKEKPIKPPKNLTGKTIVTPQGKIRPGNKVAFKKATIEEQEERIDFCLNLLIRGSTKAEIHKTMADKFKIHWRTIDDIYIVRAEKLRLERARINTGELRDFVITNLLDVAKVGKDAQRVSACAELAAIGGCYAPRRTELTGDNGGPLKVDDVTAEPKLSKSRLRELIGLAEVIGNGHSDNGNGSCKDQTADAKRT